jgi:hypothetical protein
MFKTKRLDWIAAELECLGRYNFDYDKKERERFIKLEKMVSELGEKLGYMWTSEAVKEELRGTNFYSVEERAVLKWSWKKIKK